MIQKICLKIFLLMMMFSATLLAQIYVSPAGNDTVNTGTIELPFRTISKAMSVAVAGDTIYLRGGTYIYSSTISISRNGTSDALYYLFSYPGERAILDFSSMAVGSSNRGIKLSASYWYIKGIDIEGAGDNGIYVSGSNNKIEFCAVYKNRDTGLQLSGGASNNQIINCDSYYNADPGQGNADGFAPKLDVGSNNYFYGCRSWQNSDDGYDGYLRPSNDVTTIYENCWCFMNGYLKDGSPSIGNGNGFKMGGSDDKTLMHNVIFKRCLSFKNRVKGFDQNNNKGSMTLYNCTAYNNGTNYSLSQAVDSSKTITIINCVALGSVGSIGNFAVQQTNSWMPPFVVTNSDFVSIDTTGVRGQRKTDGSLPDITYMHLAPGSGLIDMGTDIGLPYNGAAADLGAFETVNPAQVTEQEVLPEVFTLYQNYPNPFNPSTTVKYWLPTDSWVRLRVYNTTGQEIEVLVNSIEKGGYQSVEWNAGEIASGIYFYKLEARSVHTPDEAITQVKKMLLVK